MQNTYHLGFLEKELQLFSYPRTGSHFFCYCLGGLFDVVWPRDPPWLREVADRENELNPDALYALSLREPGVPLQPLLRPNGFANGVHGVPLDSEELMVILIRDPIAMAYSRYRVERDRWGGLKELSQEWVRAELSGYAHFYDKAFEVLGRQSNRALLMRWEDSVASAESLERLITFVGLVPKLRPSFVWSVARFESFVKPGNRTFYRSGKNNAWMSDSEWVRVLGEMTDLSFTRFGYLSVAHYLRGLDGPPANAANGHAVEPAGLPSEPEPRHKGALA